MRCETQQHRRSRARTRFDVALAQRAQRRRRVALLGVVRGRVIALLIVLGGVGMVALWYAGDDWRIHDIQVRNNAGVPTEAIIGASALQGEHFHFVDLDAAAQAVDDLPGVEAAMITCRWAWRAACTIAIQPARAMAVWIGPQGEVWNDFEGKVQSASSSVVAPLTIRVEDGELPLPGERLDPRLLRALNELLAAQPNVKRYSYSPQYGLIWVNQQKWRVRLGDAPYDGAMSDKLRLARALQRQLSERGVAVKELDVRFVDAPYYVR